MTSPLITGYLAGLHRRLPRAIADEAAAGLIETYEHHLAAGAGDQEAARAALADFGDLATGRRRVHPPGPGPAHRPAGCWRPGRLPARCWATALILSHAWTWPVPAMTRISLGAAPAAGGARAAGRRDQPAQLPADQARRRSPARSSWPWTPPQQQPSWLAAPALTFALSIAVIVSLGRIAFTAWMLPRLAAR